MERNTRRRRRDDETEPRQQTGGQARRQTGEGIRQETGQDRQPPRGAVRGPQRAGVDQDGGQADPQYLAQAAARQQEGEAYAMEAAGMAANAVMQQQMRAALAASPGTPSSEMVEDVAPQPPTLDDAGGGAEGMPAAGRRITAEVLHEAVATLEKYKQGKANLDRRIVDNEQWFKLRHWDTVGAQEREGELISKSAWLFNSLLNRHADAMDSFPKPTVLPREEGDRAEASILTSILPTILDRNEFEQVYSDVWWYKLKTGTGCYGVFWDSSLSGGLGDISIQKVDLLNVFWEPGISDIQDSRNVFVVSLIDRDALEAQYPQAKGKLRGGDSLNVTKYIYDDNIDTSDKAPVIDWYYKVQGADGKTVLHYCKFVDDIVLYASEDEPDYRERGFYDHGKYPLVLDALFPVEGSPVGFGYLDIMKNPQLFIDTLTGAITKNTVIKSRPKFMMREDMAVNEREFLDGQTDILHVAGNLDDMSFRQIDVDGVDGNSLNTLQFLVDELKETSGNRDFSQGSTTAGVTAASAIAALQEAGSKTARDMNKSAYRAFRQLMYFCIELIRQFYSAPRQFRVVGEDGLEKFVSYSNASLQPRVTAIFDRQFNLSPVFDVKVTAEKASPFSTLSQNELAKELYGAGFFNPQLADQALAALEMMDFEGKMMVQRRIQQNGTMYQQLLQMQQTLAQLAAIVDAQNGTTIGAGMQQAGVTGEAGAIQSTPDVQPSGVQVDAYGGARSGSSTSTAGQARTRAAELSTPR